MNDVAPDADPVPLPEVVGRYQAAHDRHDTEAAVAAFTRDASVVDEDHTYRGTDEIRHWLATAASEYVFTRTFVGAEAVDDHRWIVHNRLEGDFPGGVADLRYRFVLDGDLITELVIAP